MREGDLRDQVLDVPNVDNRLHIARKPQKPDEWDAPIEPHDPYGPGAVRSNASIFFGQCIDSLH
jgi:hypothetical protein